MIEEAEFSNTAYLGEMFISSSRRRLSVIEL